ncbi:MAG: CAP domain-containing protein [Pseudomonadota bacterium]|nr:CAP domain-containing protein [Pseudomonadota bacterium]
MKASSLLLAAWLAALPAASRANLGDAVNWARLQGCPAPVKGPLRDSPKLRQAAAQMASGVTLRSALASAGYVAAQSSAVHISGAAGDAQVGSMLAAHDCGALTNPRLMEMGAQRRGRDLWIVLAAPVALPNGSDSLLIRRQILDLVNAARANGRSCGGRAFKTAAPLTLNPALSEAAYAHSQDMASHGEFDHRGHDGSSPATRVERAGYGGYLLVGENIAAGAMSAADVAQGWLDSAAHCENIMDPRFSETGIAFAVNPSSAELVYWTQEFAAPKRAHLGAATPATR